MKEAKDCFPLCIAGQHVKITLYCFFLWPSDGIHVDSVQHPARDMVALALHSQKWDEFE